MIKLLMLTACRRDEIGKLRWAEVDLAGGMIVIPASRMKARREHRVPLSEPALAILRKRYEDRVNITHVFGACDSGVGNLSNAKKRLDRIINGNRAEPIKEWVLHDLRHAFSTHMNEAGEAPHVVEECLAHRGYKQGSAAVYNKARYESQKRALLDRWARYLVEAVGETVVSFVAREDKALPA